MRKIAILALLIAAVFITACNAIPATGDTAEQFLSAGNQMPAAPTGYQTVNADTIQGTLTAAAQAANLSTANLFGAAAVNRIETLVNCYRDVGAIDAKGYFSITEAGGGVAVVVNNTRIVNNLVQCINETAGGRNSNPSAQNAFQPCVKTGTFNVTEGEITNNFTYMYVGTTPTLCASFQTHFANKGG